jgi:hypothetical protein
VTGPPESFWMLLDAARPNLIALARELEQLPREQLVEFARLYGEASAEVCDYWAGPTVDGIAFSEDDTEDLCDWVVSRGEAYWRRIIALGGELEPAVREYWREQAGPSDLRSWTSEVDHPLYRGYQSPGAIAFAVFRIRFNEDLRDILD